MERIVHDSYAKDGFDACRQIWKGIISFACRYVVFAMLDLDIDTQHLHSLI